MKILTALCLLFVAMLTFAPPAPATQGKPPSMERARRLLNDEHWEQAVEAYGKIVAADEENGMAWYLYAYCLTQSGDVQASIEANRTSLKHGGPRDSVLYNLACDYEATDDLERAEQTLLQAIEAGYLDYDWIAADEDLVKTRALGNIPFPTPREFSMHKARNLVVMPYELILPKGHDPERETTAVVLFGVGPGPLASAWTHDVLCGGVTRDKNCIVLLVLPPERGWYTHPTHHALEDLMKSVLKQHKVQGNKFHLVGFAAGCGPASTYVDMSKRYFQSFTTLGGRPFPAGVEGQVKRMSSMPLTQVVGDQNEQGVREARHAVQLLGGESSTVQLRILEQEAPTLPSLHAGRWLDLVLKAKHQ